VWTRGDITSSQNPVRWRKQLPFLGIGASIAFALYHESSLTHNDSDELNRSAPNSSAFEKAIHRQEMLIPDWTDNGIYRVDVAALAS
jgi:hypothetical protein